MKAGAADYILKDHLTRLPEAIQRAIRERRLREEREQAVARCRSQKPSIAHCSRARPTPWGVRSGDAPRPRGERRCDQHYGYSREEFLAPADRGPAAGGGHPGPTSTPRNHARDYHNAGTWRHRKKDGTLIEVETSGHGITFAGRRAEQVVINDVTERKRLEEQFRQAQKMEAVGPPRGRRRA